MISPEAATDLQKLGYTQETLRSYIYDASSVPYEQLSPDEKKGIEARIKQSIVRAGLLADQLPLRRLPRGLDSLLGAKRRQETTDVLFWGNVVSALLIRFF